ncbi:MAG: hypothetical protein F4Y01_03885 [Gammaproteobacteria bacterium]|nr:hypothetical protein [Gammaproteobacteria bacterium]
MTDGTVVAIHEAPSQGVFVVTGGGSGLLSRLLSVPGASATVLEASVPYASQALADYLGGAPEQWCSAVTGRRLAMQAFSRARGLGGEFGFAVTASLATNRPKRGDHRAYLAYQDATATRVWTLALEKGARSRVGEEDLVAGHALAALAFSLGISSAPDLPWEEALGGPGLAELLRGERQVVAGRRFDAVLPGAFNPLHDGHRAMRAHAASRLGRPVAYELCVANVDKPALDYLDLNPRLAQFQPDEVVVTNAPTFVEKARALGGAVTFVVGADTITRIAERRYYGGRAQRDAALAELKDVGCAFLVYGRLGDDGVFKTLADLSLPPALAALCEGVGAVEFRNDVSSTALRTG